MNKLVGIHGIAQQYKGGYSLEDVWYPALRDGLVAADYPSAAERLAPADVRVAFWGDLFLPKGAMAGSEPPYSAASIQPGPERDLLTALYDAAVASDPSIGVPDGAMMGPKAPVRVMLDRLTRSPTLAKVAPRFFIGSLKQVTAFMTNPVVKADVLDRVRQKITGDTRVLIGHSLGSVVAYEYLCHDRLASVELLVTLGSPLGIPNVVFHKLSPAPVGGVGAWPGSVAAWVNVADKNDIVALRKDLAPLFPGTAPGQAINDRPVDNGKEPHAIDRYLNKPQTGTALGDVLGR